MTRASAATPWWCAPWPTTPSSWALKPHTASDKPDLEHTNQPDLIGAAVANLLDRVDSLEFSVTGHVNEFHLHATGAGQWEELDDFSI